MHGYQGTVVADTNFREKLRRETEYTLMKGLSKLWGHQIGPKLGGALHL